MSRAPERRPLSFPADQRGPREGEGGRASCAGPAGPKAACARRCRQSGRGNPSPARTGTAGARVRGAGDRRADARRSAACCATPPHGVHQRQPHSLEQGRTRRGRDRPQQMAPENPESLASCGRGSDRLTHSRVYLLERDASDAIGLCFRFLQRGNEVCSRLFLMLEQAETSRDDGGYILEAATGHGFGGEALQLGRKGDVLHDGIIVRAGAFGKVNLLPAPRGAGGYE